MRARPAVDKGAAPAAIVPRCHTRSQCRGPRHQARAVPRMNVTSALALGPTARVKRMIPRGEAPNAETKYHTTTRRRGATRRAPRRFDEGGVASTAREGEIVNHSKAIATAVTDTRESTFASAIARAAGVVTHTAATRNEKPGTATLRTARLPPKQRRWMAWGSGFMLASILFRAPGRRGRQRYHIQPSPSPITATQQGRLRGTVNLH